MSTFKTAPTVLMTFCKHFGSGKYIQKFEKIQTKILLGIPPIFGLNITINKRQTECNYLNWSYNINQQNAPLLN